jgi:transcriptional regulator with GAF, ATPase, and Fis domain
MAGSLLDITQEHWSSQRLAAQYSGSKILAESTTFEEALSKISTTMCHEMT